jgi:hypothetical protein
VVSIKKYDNSSKGPKESLVVDVNNPGLKPGDAIGGYLILRMESLEEIDSILFQLEHRATGARHVHISNRDKENTFGVAFRTVPEDSTGVAHVLEHTVLCGSEKFDVRDPFFSMLKRGLSTFMNAFTASDWTMYPFSTQNSKDFYNLMDVYLDAAFFPRLDPLSFKQEGHRLEVADPETQGAPPALIYKGVVYNEMKGAMSSPSQVMGRSLLGALYPDTTYSFNSGGEPSDIPALTHDGLKAFHARFYHPSNAFFYTYGSLPLEDHLQVIEEKVLKRFTKIDPDSAVPSQPRWDAPRTATASYPLARDEDPSNKYQACVAWLTADVKDSFEMLVLDVLEQVLLGNAASPLRKALIDSGLGAALSDGAGFDPDMRDTMFACGLKDISRESVSKVEAVIFETLEAVVSNGVDKTMVEAAIHQIEFHRKEITNSPHPFGIKLLLSVVGPWIHEGDPVVCLKFDADLERLNREMEKGCFLEERIKTYFLDNPHRVLFTLAPDQEMEKKEKQNTAEELSSILKDTSATGLAQIEADAATLAALQDAKEDLSSLPTLELVDVPPEIEIIHPDTVDRVTTATCYDKATSGILYFSCPTGLGAMPEELFPLVPFFCRAFTGAGTAVRNYADMAARMNLYTGGVALSPVSGTGFSDKEACLPFVALQGKALDRNVAKLFDIITELVSQYSFGDHTRLKNLLLQCKAGMESSIVASGHRYAISLAARNLTQASYLGEIWNGIAQYQYIKALAEKVEDKETEQETLEGLERDLGRIANLLFKQENLRPAIVGETASLELADASIRAMIETLPGNNGDSLTPPDLDFDTTLPHEGWITSTQVSFVAQAFKTVRMGHEDAPALSVIAKMLRSLYLHREIREKGGAYGGFAMYSPEEGIFSFGSYRDPYIRRTLSVYRDSCDFIINGDYSEEDVKEAIFQVCSEIDKPETPGPASIKAFYRDILMLTDEKRKQFKAALLKLDKGCIQGCAERYFRIEASKKGIAVISGQDLLDAANQALAEGEFPLELHRI